MFAQDTDATRRESRMVGVVSMSLWIVIIVLGRFTAYFADPLYRSMHIF